MVTPVCSLMLNQSGLPVQAQHLQGSFSSLAYNTQCLQDT